MTIQCKVCGCSIKSIGPASVNDAHEVLELMAKHLVSRHKRQAQSLKEQIDTLFLLLSTYMMIRHYVTIPPDEIELFQKVHEGELALMSLLSAEEKTVS